jgi:hypothetical protein
MINMIQGPASCARSILSRRRKRVTRRLTTGLTAAACGLAMVTGAALMTGCTSQNNPQPLTQQAPRTAPRDADRVATGSGELSYKAPTDGTLYAEDHNTGTTVFVKRLRAGQRLDYQANNGTVTLDGRPQRIPDLDQHRGHDFRMYFKSDEQK